MGFSNQLPLKYVWYPRSAARASGAIFNARGLSQDARAPKLAPRSLVSSATALAQWRRLLGPDEKILVHTQALRFELDPACAKATAGHLTNPSHAVLFEEGPIAASLGQPVADQLYGAWTSLRGLGVGW